MEIKVSINCITFNHEKYIAKAIDSFLMQETNFAYEILIHDDASTDRTPEIIKEYEKKYPEIIKVIYQQENQYSKGVNIFKINTARASGKYIAICEGDDYWLDPQKLQKQVEYMDSHDDCSLCVHAGTLVNIYSRETIPYRTNLIENKIFTTEEIIKGGGGLFLTNSMLYRTSEKDNYPSFFDKLPFLDYPLVINLSLKGYVYYMPEVMSAYRQGVEGSWTDRIMINKDKLTKHYIIVVEMLEKINLYTNYKYENVIKEAQIEKLYPIILYYKKNNKKLTPFLLNLYKEMKIKTKMKIYLVSILSILKGLIRNE